MRVGYFKGGEQWKEIRADLQRPGARMVTDRGERGRKERCENRDGEGWGTTEKRRSGREELRS